ncbi:MAG: cobyric acid synthase [Chloroflexota bacterium]
MTGRCLMVVGASSSAGKSLTVAALCRIFARRGVRVAPFKAQNMSNNAAVCLDGSEIGRAQALQALAAGVPFSADLNPVLIKPEADARSQVVVMGRPFKTLAARSYYEYTAELWQVITAALDRLRAEYDLVIIEGAGSPVELNLKAGDLVNMRVAQYAQAATLLVGDIDRGGIFAQLLGTLWLLEPDERRLVRGLVINKFRGDLSLFQDGVQILEQRGGVPVLGVVPYLKDLGLPEEDAVALDQPAQADSAQPALEIAVVRLPLIANFDDFDPFRHDPGVRVRYVDRPAELGQPQAVILPGTKSTLADLEWLQRSGLAAAIRQHAARGGAVVGICGGYQMLGTRLLDPLHSESDAGGGSGLGLLPVETIFEAEKITHQARAVVNSPTGGLPGWLGSLDGQQLHGYEIHMGRTHSPNPWLRITQRGARPASEPDGAASADGRVWGCYLHGLFENSRFRRAWLESLGWTASMPGDHPVLTLQRALDRLADAVERSLDIQKLEAMLWEN